MARTCKPHIATGKTHPLGGMRRKAGGVRRKSTAHESTLAMREAVLQVIAHRVGGRTAASRRLEGSRSPPPRLAARHRPWPKARLVLARPDGFGLMCVANEERACGAGGWNRPPGPIVEGGLMRRTDNLSHGEGLN